MSGAYPNPRQLRYSVALVLLSVLVHASRDLSRYLDRLSGFFLARGEAADRPAPESYVFSWSRDCALPEVPAAFVRRRGEVSREICQPTDPRERNAHVSRAVALERRLTQELADGSDAVGAYEVGLYVRAAVVRLPERGHVYLFNPLFAAVNGTVDCWERESRDAAPVKSRRHRFVRVRYESPYELDAAGYLPKREFVELQGRAACAVQNVFERMNRS